MRVPVQPSEALPARRWRSLCHRDLAKERQGLLSVPKLRIAARDLPSQKHKHGYSSGCSCALSNWPIAHQRTSTLTTTEETTVTGPWMGRGGHPKLSTYFVCTYCTVRTVYVPGHNNNTASTTLRACPRLDDLYCATMPRRSCELKHDWGLSLPCTDLLTVARSAIVYSWLRTKKLVGAFDNNKVYIPHFEAKNRKVPLTSYISILFAQLALPVPRRIRAIQLATSL